MGGTAVLDPPFVRAATHRLQRATGRAGRDGDRVGGLHRIESEQDGSRRRGADGAECRTGTHAAADQAAGDGFAGTEPFQRGVTGRECGQNGAQRRIQCFAQGHRDRRDQRSRMGPGVMIGIVLKMRMHGDAVGEHRLGQYRMPAVRPEARGPHAGRDLRRHSAGRCRRRLVARHEYQPQRVEQTDGGLRSDIGRQFGSRRARGESTEPRGRVHCGTHHKYSSASATSRISATVPLRLISPPRIT